MAHPEIIRQDETTIWFTLSNKPQYECVIDAEDYYKHVHGTTSWYIHKSKQTPGATPYIRRALGDRHAHLHREVLGLGKWSNDSVVDHDNCIGYDCRKSNLVHTNTHGNNQKLRRHGRVRRALGILSKSIIPEDDMFLNCSVTSRVRGPNNRVQYQAYNGKEFVTTATSIDQLRARIIEKLKGIKNE